MRLGDNTCRELRHRLSPATISVAKDVSIRMGYIKAITHSLNQNEELEKSKRPERLFGCVLNP